MRLTSLHIHLAAVGRPPAHEDGFPRSVSNQEQVSEQREIEREREREREREARK